MTELDEAALDRAADEWDGLDLDAVLRTLARELPSFTAEFNERYAQPQGHK